MLFTIGYNPNICNYTKNLNRLHAKYLLQQKPTSKWSMSFWYFPFSMIMKEADLGMESRQRALRNWQSSLCPPTPPSPRPSPIYPHPKLVHADILWKKRTIVRHIICQVPFFMSHIQHFKGDFLWTWKIWAKSYKRKLSVSEAPLQHLNCHQSVYSVFVFCKIFFLCVCKNFLVFEIQIINSTISTVINLFRILWNLYFFVFTDSSYLCICKAF